jgi:hypothetical protein
MPCDLLNCGLITANTLQMRIISWLEAQELLKKVERCSPVLDEKKREVLVEEGGKVIFRMKLPLLLPQKLSLSQLKETELQPHNFLLILMRAGNAAVAFFAFGRMLRHKVIRRYMVRKKQGKAQITHLKTKGKSRYGARLRLQQTRIFFEEINRTANRYFEAGDIRRVFIFMPKNFGKFISSSAVKPLYLKNIKPEKIPFPVRTPNFHELQKISLLMQKAFLLLDEIADIPFSERLDEERDADLWA